MPPTSNALLLAFGTLTIYRVPAPREVDRRVAGWAMALAPVVAVTIAAPLLLLSLLLEDRWSPLMIAVLWVAGLAVLTRALHLDGLADTADGLGSRKPPAEALEIMRRGDVGPFGVTALVLVLVVQVAASAQLVATYDDGPAMLALAVVVSRLVLPCICLRGFPAARSDGLGATVAGSVNPAQLGVSVLLTLVVALGIGTVVGPGDVAPLLYVVLGLAAGIGYCWWCVRRLGGVTGDVLGACVEVTFTASLVAMTLA